ncbi:hypothetical protein UFOVP274_2 [uncultured Caudovirales phage]|uniref:Uncharacterized protein n=1 Tax=uncultured Caudovirales phage TaxID=2100421 RepID=A0A6J5LNP5_9CAUD|nr:hypothetical protein UFOVP274_2 [uncultured Caudovirales phage]
MRVYKVGHKDGSVRLVRAAMKNQAVAHAAQSDYTVQVASQDDLIELTKKGVEVENLRSHQQMDLV